MTPVHAAFRIGGGTRAGANLVVCLMFGLWLQVLALTVSPAFHEWLHTGSKSATHECPVTLLNKGNLALDSGAEITIRVPLEIASPAVALDRFWIPSENYRLSPSRAPPSC